MTEIIIALSDAGLPVLLQLPCPAAFLHFIHHDVQLAY